MKLPRFLFRRAKSQRPSQDKSKGQPCSPTDLKRQMELCIREGDRLRDGNNPAEAAKSYQAALAIDPDRTDIRVQFGNMLKDAGRYSEAETAYRQAMTKNPQDPDIRLQLGHALKLQGQRRAALAEYRHVVELDPRAVQAVMELASAGEPDQQLEVYEAQLRAGGTEALLTFVGEIVDMRRRLEGMLAMLPSVQAYTAFPIARYGQFRRVFDVPAPPPGCQGGFTVCLLADGEPLETLYRQLSSLRAQCHGEWRLLGIGSNAARRQVVERAALSDPRFAWIESATTEPLAARELRLLCAADTEWHLLLAKGAILHRHALGWIATAGEWGDVAAFICDEEAGSDQERTAPTLRQVVDYDTLLETNVFGNTIALRGSFRSQIQELSLLTTSVIAARSSLLLHLARGEGVGHIPLPLVWRPDPKIEPTDAADHQAAVATHLIAIHSMAKIELASGKPVPPVLPITWRPNPTDMPVGVVIATRDNAEDVQLLVNSLLDTAAIRALVRIIVVDNGSQESSRQVLDQLVQSSGIKLVTINSPFNWSRLNNQAAQLLETPLLVFANDDMQMLTHGWDERLRGLLTRPDIGAVGARLLYPDDTLQHGGIVFGWHGAPTHHDGLYEPATAPGPTQRWQVTRAVSAVTGAFLATHRDVFLALGGFDETELAVSYGDIDFALKIRATGRRVLWTPHITLYHYESKTRGLDHLDAAKAARNAAEKQVMQTRWGAALHRDPSVNPTWHSATMPFRLIRSASEQSIRQHIQDCASLHPWLTSPVGDCGDR